jgi:hypothetical protein
MQLGSGGYRADFRGQAVRLARSDVPHGQANLGDRGTSGQLVTDGSGRPAAGTRSPRADPDDLLGRTRGARVRCHWPSLIFCAVPCGPAARLARLWVRKSREGQGQQLLTVTGAPAVTFAPGFQVRSRPSNRINAHLSRLEPAQMHINPVPRGRRPGWRGHPPIRRGRRPSWQGRRPGRIDRANVFGPGTGCLPRPGPAR